MNFTPVLAAGGNYSDDGEPTIDALVQWIYAHVADSQEWHLPFGIHIYLPDWISLHAVMLLLCSLFLFIIFGVMYKKKQTVPTGVTNFLEVFVLFVRNDISIANLGEEDGKKYAPLFLTFFFFILGLNIMGLIPLFSTATGNIGVTLGLTTFTFLTMTLVAMIKNGIGGFFGAFIPHGVPTPVLFLLTPIEMAGVVIKCFALTIRLFANMMAGHIIVFALLGLLYLFKAYAAPALPMAVAIYFLEILVAFLQAYIFTFLSSMFIGQIFHPEH